MLARQTLLLFIVGLLLWPAAGFAADTPAAPRDKVAEARRLFAEPEVSSFIRLLDDPDVRTALLRAPRSPDRANDLMLGQRLDAGLSGLRTRIIGFITALPMVPGQLVYAASVARQALPGREALHAALGLVILLGAGMLTRFVAVRALAPWRRRIGTAAMETPSQRRAIILARLTYACINLASVALGSLGGYTVLAWQSAAGTVVLSYLLAALAVGCSLVITRFVLAPGAERFRLLPIPTAAAWYWHVSLALLTGTAAFGWVTVSLIRLFGGNPLVADALSHIVGMIVVLLFIFAAWTGWYKARRHGCERAARRLALFLSTYWPLVWLCFLDEAPQSGWTLIAVAGVPVAVYLIHRIVTAVERGPETADARPVSAWTVLIERSLQSLVLLVIATLVVRNWGVDLQALAQGDTMQVRFVSSAFEALLVIVAAELIWQLAHAAIDTHLHRLHEGAMSSDQMELRRRARLGTLLPLLRTSVLISVIAVATMTVLSAVGVEIAPLLAGAGVIGVAVGFGAQTLVRDVIAGIFFLLDDAFRVGEYIESGSLRGTVESFSLRSMKLREITGQLHTIPLGEFRSITNYSREWASQELQVGVRHDTDLTTVERAIQEVSDRLITDPAFAESIIDPLRSMGISGIGDYAIRIGLIVKTRPGAQFAVRAAAYKLIKQVFEQHGIRLASPTLLVGNEAFLPTRSEPYSPPAA